MVVFEVRFLPVILFSILQRKNLFLARLKGLSILKLFLHSKGDFILVVACLQALVHNLYVRA